MEWQTIETAPRDGTRFLGINMRGHPQHRQSYICWSAAAPEGQHWAIDAGWLIGYQNTYYPTHWMPLPENPK